jgi:hypothetical protein
LGTERYRSGYFGRAANPKKREQTNLKIISAGAANPNIFGRAANPKSRYLWIISAGAANPKKKATNKSKKQIFL